MLSQNNQSTRRFFKDFGVVRATPIDWSEPPIGCSYPNQHRPWAPPWSIDTSNPNDYLMELLTKRSVFDTSNMSSFAELDALQQERDDGSYESRVKMSTRSHW